jgi:hypothetical protein
VPWCAGRGYRLGDRVFFEGAEYRCRQPHAAARRFQPPRAPALWASYDRADLTASPSAVASAAEATPPRIILCCAGEGDRWGNYLGVPKHLAPFDGRPLLERTVGHLRGRGLDDIVITAFDPRYQLEGTCRCEPRTSILPDTGIGFSREFWSTTGRTVILLGDVYFSDAALDAILGCTTAETTWLGRKGPGSLGKYAEMFGLSLPLHRQSQLEKAATEAVLLFQWGITERLMGWQLYAVLCGLDATAASPGPNWIDVDDETEDFDFPRDYQAWMARYRPG